MKNHLYTALILLVLSLLITSCGNSGNEADSSAELVDLSEASFTSLSPIMIISEPEDIFFERPSLLKPGPDNLLYLSDGGSQRIHRFDQDGQYVSSIGNSGRGPGEFQQISTFFFTPQNQMFVYDTNGFWINRFDWNEGESDWEYADRFSVFNMSGSDEPPRMPFSAFPLDSGNVAVAYTFSSPFRSGDDSDEGSDPVLIRTYSPDGELMNSYAFEAQSEQMIQIERGESIMFIPQPFGGMNLVQVSPDGYVVHNWSSQNTLTRYNLDETASGSDMAAALENTESAVRFEIPLHPIPVSSGDISRFMDNANVPDPSAVRSNMPETKPFFQSMKIADDGKIYFSGYSMFTTEETNEHSMMVFNPETNRFDGMYTTGMRGISHIENGLIYGISFNEDGMGEGRIYRVE